MKIIWVTTDWNTPYRIATGEMGGVGFYRAYAPAYALERCGHEVTVYGHNLTHQLDSEDLFNSYKKVFEGSDLVVIKQADTSNAGKLIGACKELGIPIAMDLDDLITELDPDNPATELGYEKGGAKRGLAVASLSMVDALITSTQPLADEYKKFLKKSLKVDMPTYVLPNCCDANLWTKMAKNESEHTIVGWQGSITHDHDLKLILPTMHKLMDKYPKLVLSLTGGVRQDTYDKIIKKKFSKDALERIITLRGTESYNRFPEYMSRHQWDIGIVPLKDTKFARGKSHIKWLENSLLGVPTVASGVYPYTEPIQGTPVIEDGFTGLIVKSNKTKEWIEKIELLINDERKRFYLARDARNFVLNNWQYKHHIHKWEKAFTRIIKEGSKRL